MSGVPGGMAGEVDETMTVVWAQTVNQEFEYWGQAASQAFPNVWNGTTTLAIRPSLVSG